MSRPTVPAVVKALVLLVPIALLEVACSRPPEQQMLTQFFRAARGRDNTTAALMSTVTVDPRNQGSVESFTITSVSPERREPISFQPLIDAAEKARTDEATFQREKKVYSDANLKVIEEILKLESNPMATLTREQAAVKPIWDKWRADTAMYVKNLTTTRTAISTATAPVEASLSQPGQAAFDINTFQGEMVSKDVSIAAQVKSPLDEVSEKNLVVTMSKAVGTQAGTAREGKWIITKIAGL